MSRRKVQSTEPPYSPAWVAACYGVKVDEPCPVVEIEFPDWATVSQPKPPPRLPPVPREFVRLPNKRGYRSVETAQMLDHIKDRFG